MQTIAKRFVHNHQLQWKLFQNICRIHWPKNRPNGEQLNFKTTNLMLSKYAAYIQHTSDTHIENVAIHYYIFTFGDSAEYRIGHMPYVISTTITYYNKECK